ncbi:heavy metal translocating P-type ATPase metal-binding domain-containing protein [Undibacterium fentianense]|uniref:heavy metal translocating P-type ATPase metal-binding domain-containing protein n=1 Tax=Undibacterium fentianense TaxID=2828728 RepID=UPI0034DD8F99
MHLSPSQFFHTHIAPLFKRERCLCYHCGESMRVEGALTVNFQHVLRPVCCHGCLAVLNTIQQNGLTEEYLRSKEQVESSLI